MNRASLKKEIGEAIDTIRARPAATLADIIDSMQGKSIYIYGAGSFGREIFGVLSSYGLAISGFLDMRGKKGESLFGVPVCKADEQGLDGDRKNAIVLFAIVTDKGNRDRILDHITDCGFSRIIDAQNIRCRLVRADRCLVDNLNPDYLEPRRNHIIDCLDMWADDESARIYAANVCAHILRNYDLCIESDAEVQYFPQHICLRRGYSRFIDCGGYIGDTIKGLVRTGSQIDAVACFEPNLENFTKLMEQADRLRESIAEIILFPCAVSDKAELLNFNCMGGSSHIAAEGVTVIQSVALDNALKGFSPTYIKMDIEGAEHNALLGARIMIEECRPDLAVCLYHRVNHLWEIPELIYSWGLGYKFYLRAHSTCTMETVMYATSDS